MAKDDIRYERAPRWQIFLEVAALLTLIVYTTLAGLQWEAMHDALLVDQRAWVSVVVPANFPLEGSTIAASILVGNTGKTPAKDIEGDVIATVLKKGEEPTFDFGKGHPHNRIHAGAIFPNGPINVTIPVVVTVADPVFVQLPNVTFNTTVGVNPANQVISVTSSGTVIRFTPVAIEGKGGNWLTVSPSSNGCCNTPTNVTVSVISSGLAAGSYTAQINVYEFANPAKSMTIPVVLNIAP